MNIYESEISIKARETLPLNGPGNYRVKEGVIWTRAIEINAVRHCNLSCRGCSHSSPLEEPFVLPPNEIEYSLRKLSGFLKAETVRIVGGEPLLHPNLYDLLHTVKKSEIADNICLVTNGILLNQINEDILNEIDEIQISLYPMPEHITNRIYEDAEKLKGICKKVKVLNYSSFREPIANNPTENSCLCNKIYKTCQIAHFWRCITVEPGFIYRCPQSMVLMRNQNLKSLASDRLEINKINDVSVILKYLENNKPLASCAWCLGSVGTIFKHEFIHKELWKENLPKAPDTNIDYKFMEQLEKDARLNNKCMKICKR